MAFQWTEGVIIGIAVGGGCLLFGVVASIVIITVRSKHRRLLARIDANPEERSRRLSGIFNITDQDVARMPGTRPSPSGSLQSPYGRSLYTPMSSRDTFDSPETLTKSSKAFKTHQDIDENVRSYPVPARLRRSSKKPKTKKRSQSVALSPITERHRSGGTALPVTKDTLRMVNPSPKTNTQAAASIEPTFVTGPDIALNEIETPKPLFHSKRKLSYSNPPNTVPRNSGASSTAAGLYTMDVKDTTPQPFEGSRPRSQSLHNRDSGLVPNHCPPPLPSHAPQISMLPWELVPSRLQRGRSQKASKETRLSDGSIMSANTSLLDDEKPRGFSQVLSIGIPSPAIAELSDNRLEDTKGTLCDPSAIQDRSLSRDAPKNAVTRPQMNSQKSFQAEIQTSLPKSTSSSLSINMSLNPLRKSESTTNLNNLANAADVQPSLPKIKSADMKKTRRDSSRSASLSCSNTFEIHDDSKYKRLSSPILQPTSGNRKSPMTSPDTTVRSSVATETSYDWDLDNPMPVAKGRLSLHKCQNFAQAPGSADVAFPTSAPFLFRELEGTPSQSNPPATMIKKQRKTSADFRPPSTLLFDPQFAYTPGSQSPKVERHSMSLADMPRYEGQSSPEQEMYTPTKKAGGRRRHHHRYKSIIGHPGMTAWPLLRTEDSDFNPSAVDADPSKPNIFRQSVQLSQQDDSEVDSRPSSCSIPSFPIPPSPVRRLHQPNWRGPKTPIFHPMGPRPMLPSASRIPVRHQPLLRGSSRRSPTRSAGVKKPRGHSPSKSNSTSPSKIHSTISALRRMNSEANTEVTVRGSQEHKRYQSIGEYFEKETFGDGEVLGGGKENVRQSTQGPRAMPLTGYVEKISSESSRYNLLHDGKVVGSYDEKGFLKEDSTSESGF